MFFFSFLNWIALVVFDVILEDVRERFNMFLRLRDCHRKGELIDTSISTNERKKKIFPELESLHFRQFWEGDK